MNDKTEQRVAGNFDRILSGDRDRIGVVINQLLLVDGKKSLINREMDGDEVLLKMGKIGLKGDYIDVRVSDLVSVVRKSPLGGSNTITQEILGTDGNIVDCGEVVINGRVVEGAKITVVREKKYVGQNLLPQTTGYVVYFASEDLMNKFVSAIDK